MCIPPTAIHHYDVCAYLEYLAKDTPSPRTISNHLSHLRTYFRKVGVPTNELDHQRVRWAMVATSRNKEYTPRIKLAFPVADLHRMIDTLPTSPHGNIIRTSILLMFYAALRQSEVLPPSAPAFNPKIHLTRGDVTIHQHSIVVLIKHAKNMQSIYDTKTVSLQASPNQRLCIVAAVQQMIQNTPTLAPADPFIMCPNSRRPATVDYIRRNWNAHLEQHGLSTSALSLHSIRKAAATAAHQQGCPEIDIQRYGGWRSNAHRQYITTSQAQVNAAIISALTDI